MNRNRVYQLIDSERAYQDKLPSTRTDGQPRTVGDYLTMFQYYLDKAAEAWVMNPGDQSALDVVRKLAGIAVHCMEDHGAPPRALAPGYLPPGIPDVFFSRTPAPVALPPKPVKAKPFTKKAKPKKPR